MSPKKYVPLLILVLVFLGLGFWLFPPTSGSDVAIPQDQETIARGEYLAQAAGCISCHISKDEPPALSGGHALESDFGTFYVPNITPDPTTGIGLWSGRDLLNAIRHGRSPSGSYYFPAFPYRSYAAMTEDDALAIAAWLMAQQPVSANAPAHQIGVPVWLGRMAMGPWNRLADSKQPQAQVSDDTQIERGAYLARVLGHCGECHTPRDRFGIPDFSREFEGAELGVGHAEGIDKEALSGWTENDLALLLFLGLKPNDDYVGGAMEDVIKYNTAPLTQEDRQALAAFFIRGQ